MCTQHSNGVALPSAEERHERASFLALLPMFDLLDVASEQYQRCLCALSRCSKSGRISREELKARAGLSFTGDALGIDLLLAKLGLCAIKGWLSNERNGSFIRIMCGTL